MPASDYKVKYSHVLSDYLISLVQATQYIYKHKLFFIGFCHIFCSISEPESGCDMKRKAGPGAGWLTIFVSIYSLFRSKIDASYLVPRVIFQKSFR